MAFQPPSWRYRFHEGAYHHESFVREIGRGDREHMSGRHQQSGSGSTRSVSFPVIALAVLFVVALAAVMLTVLRTDKKSPVAKAENCPGTLTLEVAAAPPVAGPVAAIAKDWTNSGPVVSGKCVQVTVTSNATIKQEQALANGGGGSTAIWLPDSTIWAQRLVSDDAGGSSAISKIDVRPSIGSSPLVIVASPDRAARMVGHSTASGWKSFVAGQLPVTIADPVANSEGLLSLLTVKSLISTAKAGQSLDLVAVMIAISHSTLPKTSDGFDKLAADPAGAPLFTASEQQVIQENRAKRSVFAVAVYPDEGTMSFDFPLVRLSRATDDPALAAAATEFEKQLRGSSAKAKLADSGLRDAEGHPVVGAGADQGVISGAVPQLPNVTPADAVDLLRLWSAATADTNTLAVIDVSGSMAEPAGNGQTKIQVATAAAKAAVSFFPDTSNLGLWVFSSNQSTNTPWAQLVPVGLLKDKVGTTPRRQALLAAASSMPSRVHGGTALYDTSLAAFEAIRNGYNPGKVNSVVLLTDGQNDYQASIDLPTLLSKLRTEVDGARPLPIITIGIGDKVDPSALQQISAVTGGKSYIVKNPNDIPGVFLDAVVQRRCRPSC
jgi:Ca-activated chloride channel family protein